jgi:N-methylhydantoinase B
MKEKSCADTANYSVDPITLEVIRHGLVSITDQIDANITRTAFSPYIYEYKDFAVGLVSADGDLIAQCTGGMPVFVADSVGMAVRDGLDVYGRERLHHGDVVVCNHAAIQGQHLNNTVMYTPIYAGPQRGGYGPPSERPRELIERDLRRGYVSVEAAERDYGVKVSL